MDEHRPAWSRVRRWSTKGVITISAIACLAYVPYILLGIWNRIFGGWRSIFFCYAGSPNFVATYAPRSIVQFFRWIPSPIGVLSQNGARGLVLASPISEVDFLDPANATEFRRLRQRLARIAWLIGAKEVNLAGILPGVLKTDDVLSLRDSRPIVTAAVSEAVRQTALGPGWPTRPPVILLGGAGHIGTPIAAFLKSGPYEIHIVDAKTGTAKLPDAVRGQRALLVDLSRRGVIRDYIDQMWPGLTVLNETFPRPASADVAAMTARGVTVLHLSGVAGHVTPPLPFGYDNAVPCCAAHGVGAVPAVRIATLGVPDLQATPTADAGLRPEKHPVAAI